MWFSACDSFSDDVACSLMLLKITDLCSVESDTFFDRLLRIREGEVTRPEVDCVLPSLAESMWPYFRDRLYVYRRFAGLNRRTGLGWEQVSGNDMFDGPYYDSWEIE